MLGLCSRRVGGKEGCRKGTETGGAKERAVQLIFPLWWPGWEEKYQAASVLLWDVPPVQTNGPRASGLMGTRPAQGPNLVFLFSLFFSLSLSLYDERSTNTHSSWRTHFNYPKQTWKYSLFLSQVFPHSDSSWRSLFLHQHWPSWPLSSQIPLTCIYLHRHTLSNFHMLSLSHLLSSLCFLLSMHHTKNFTHINTDSLFLSNPYLSFTKTSSVWKYYLNPTSYNSKFTVVQDQRHHVDLLGAEWDQFVPGYNVWMFSLWGSRVYQWMSSQSHCRLNVNVLFQ